MQEGNSATADGAYKAPRHDQVSRSAVLHVAAEVGAAAGAAAIWARKGAPSHILHATGQSAFAAFTTCNFAMHVAKDGAIAKLSHT